jgi:hypothetical protein
MYWFIASLVMTAANTVVAIRENNSTSWLLFTISLALTVFCTVRFLMEAS